MKFGHTHIDNRILRPIIYMFTILLVEMTVVAYLYFTITKKAAVLTEKRAFSYDFYNQISNFESLKKEYDKTKPLLAAVADAVPSQEHIYKTYEQMGRIADRLGMPISISLEGQNPLPSSIGGFSYVPFTATFEGNASSVQSYIEEIERQPIFVTVDSLSIISSQSIHAPGIIELHGKLYTR